MKKENINNFQLRSDNQTEVPESVIIIIIIFEDIENMPLSNIPVKNPGRYLEQFVKIVQPRGGDSMGTTAREGMASRYYYTIYTLY